MGKKIKHTLWLSVLFFFVAIRGLADDGLKKKTGNGTRINFGPVAGFYAFSSKHAKNLSQKTGFLAGFRREIHYDRSFKNYFAFGVDYLLHGINFNSYYFYPDSLQLYDKSFAYNYTLYIHEINLPLQFKFLFKRADNSLYSPYIDLGYNLRYLAGSNLRVTQAGKLIKKDTPDLQFRNPLITDKLNASVSIGFGWQKNNLASSKGSFFAELNFRYGFSPYYFQTAYSASSLYINGTQLSLQLGIKL